MKQLLLGLFGVVLLTTPSSAQDKQSLNIAGKTKTAILADEQQKKDWYDGVFKLSPAVRAGDYIYLSGMVSGAFSSKEPIGQEGYKKDLRRAFGEIKRTLEAGDANMNDIVKMRTFHVFDSPHVTIGKQQQVLAFAEIKSEFIGEPHPAWTAIGVKELFPDRGLVEIEVVVYSPKKK